MMLLTAIILLLGFIALAGMVSRVSLLAQQAGLEQDRPILREVEPLQLGLNRTLTSLQDDYGLSGHALQNATVAALNHYKQLEHAKGMLLRWNLTCIPAGQTTAGRVLVTLSDGELTITLAPRATFTRPNCDVLTG